MRRVAVGMVTLAAVIALRTEAVASEAGPREVLLEGVNEIHAPGVPGPLSVFGPDATVVAVGQATRGVSAPVVATTLLGAGRVVAFGHTGYLTPDDATDTGRLLLNAARWAAGEAGQRPEVGVYGSPRLLRLLRDADFVPRELSQDDLSSALDGLSVICVGAHELDDEAALHAVRSFVDAGGGLLTAGLGWGWSQLNPGRDIATQHPGNRLLAPAGVVWGDGTLSRTSEHGYATVEDPPKTTHAKRALAQLVTDATREDAAQAAWIVTHAIRSCPPSDSLFLPLIDAAPTPAVAPEWPLGPEHALARVAVAREVVAASLSAPGDIAPHPSATAFPGAVPDDAARRQSVLVDVDLSRLGWHGTGLYAPPGEAIHIAADVPATEVGLTVRIGAHADSLWHKAEWSRAPQITRVFPIVADATEAACAFGGLLYISVPRGLSGSASLTIEGAVAAPRFVLGQTTDDDWRERVRDLPGPWAEFETAKVVLTVPTDIARRVDNPTELMEFWDRVMDACADLAAIPRERARPERIVADIQISAGYMHAGYPIMTHLDAAEVAVDLDGLRQGSWGHFHEIGHNHQSPDWTFGGTGEVTCNLFTLYVYDKVCGIAPSDSRDTLSDERVLTAAREHADAGSPFAEWRSRPFLALTMYHQMQQEFGWEPFVDVFREYRQLVDADRPGSDEAKRDQWMVRFSRRVGRDLGPFFEAWGVPTSEEARASIARLEPWLPAPFDE
ncbi:hypothetical protein HN371_07710 [Candidatus Poribacteria bacterium]|nr:hypothetical protein [Candidatus Poribacteria bacterium]MBT5713635.1 hypothetical protein [Candidatus Poribacteria bacterium]MBT7808205.1 hypothetical protein [Candidatus Poribacteria bacterium]